MSRKKKEERKTQKGKFKNKLCFLAAAVAAGTITTEDKKLYGGNVCTVRVTGVTTGNPTTLGSAPGTDAIACGDGAIANGMSAIATGKGSFTGYNKAVAIGENATALRESDVAIGAGAGLYNQGLNAKTLPNTASKTRGYNVIIGANAMVGDDNNTSVHTSQGIAIGGSGTTRDAGARKYGDSGGAWAKGDQSIAIGGDTIAEGASSIAIGGDDLQKAAAKSVTYTLGSGSKTASLLTAMSDLAGVAPGDITSFNATKSGSGAVALGVKSISGDLSLAIGTMSKANKVNATAVGTGAVADLDNSVAIGGGATTANAAGTQETSATINGVTYSNFAGGSGTKVGDVVSLGKNGTFNRQIKNVAAGNISATSTDAVNGSQLYSVAQTLQDRFKYVSINSTETGNADNKGALATNSIAIGPNASATVTSENAVVVGNGAKTTEQVMNSGTPTQWTKTGKNSVVIGNKASTNSEGSVAIGHEAKVDNTTNNSGSTIGRYKNDDNSTYMGTSLAQNNIYADPSYVGTQGIAIGANSYSDYQGMSMGVGARSKNLSLALGYFSNAEGTSSIATGVGAYAKGDNSISSGRQSSTISTGSVALGVAARGGSTADGGLGGSIAVGAASDATHEQAIAIGGITNANTATLEQGRGDNTQATAARATAIGANAKAQAESSIAFGTKASVGSAGTNAVAIGKDSSATVANGVALGSESKATTAAGVTGFDMADGRSNVYSGLAGTAKTANMAAVSVGDGANKTRQITGVAAGKEDTDAVNVAQLKSTNLKIAGNTTSGGADVRLHDQTLTVKGDGTYLTSTAAGNTITMELKQDVKDKIDNAATKKLDNLDPTGVQKIKDTAAWNVVANSGTAEKVQGGDTVKFIDGDNIEITQAGKDFTFATKKDVTFDSVTINNGPKLSSTGIDAGNKKISNLADGTANNDAVNLGQLNTAINNAGAAATIKYKANGGTAETVRLSDGLDFVNGSNTTATVGPNGVVKYDVNLGTLAVGADGKAGADGKTGADGTVGKDGIATTQDVAKAINNSAWKVTSTASTGTVNTPSVEDVKNGDTVKFDAGDNIEITQNGKDFTFATKKDVKFDSVTINNGGPKLSATGIDAANKKITNVANGDVTATSKDAVNGSQLYGLSKNTVTVSGDSTSTTPQTLDQNGGIKLGIKSGDTQYLTSTATGTDITLDLTPDAKAKINKVATLSSNTISLGGDTGTTNTQSLDKTGGIKFNVKGDGTYLTSNATNDDVTLDLTQTTKDKINNAATNKLDNLDPAGVQKIKDTAAWNVVANAGTAEKVQGGDTVKFINGDNIEVTQAGKDFTFATKKDVTFDSVTINNGPKLSSTGIDAGNKTISNVANGTANNDAVNLGQLNNAINNATTTATSTEKVVASTAADNIATVAPSTGQNLGDKNATYEVSVSKTAVQNIAKDAAAWNVVANSGTAQKVEGGDTVKFLNGDNIQITQAGKDFTIATKRDVTFDSVTIPTGNVVINNSGINAGGKTISNVANGTDNDDAVNLGQLNAVKNSPIKFGGDSGTDVDRKLGEKLNIKGGATGNLTNNNIAVEADGNDTLNIKLAENVNLGTNGSVKIGDSTLNNDGLTITGGPSITKTGGINAGGKTISNVADGTANDHAVNLGQLNNAINNATTTATSTEKVVASTAADNIATVAPSTGQNLGDKNATYEVSVSKTAVQNIAKDAAAWNVSTNGGTAEKVEGGDTVNFVNGDNIEVTNTGKDITIATKRDVNFDSVTVPAGAGNVVINNSGINAGNNKITNVADGTIAPGSKDAVNGGQLHDVQNTINAGAFTVSANGGAKDRIAKDENIDFENADGNIAISYDATGNKFTYNLSPNLNLGPAGSLRIGDALLNNGGLTIVNGPSITSAGVDAGNKKVTNVADGTIGAGSKDAINGGQLHDVQTNLQTSINNNAQNIANNTNAINNLNAAVNNPITFTGDSGNNIDRKLGETLNIKGGATGNLTSGNIGVEADSTTNTLNVKLAENIDLGTNGSVKTGDTKINDNGLTINGGPSVTKAGIDAGNKKVTNVANGDITATSKDAVNGSQLHGVADSIKNSIGGNTILNPDGTITANNIGGTGHNNIHDAIASVNNAANQRTTVVAGDNIDVTVSTNATGGNEYTVATKRDIVVDSVSVANNGPSMNSNGINAGGKTISNLGAGVNPNDAVNVAQLDAVKNSPITFGADTGTDHAATLGSRVSITGDNKNITTSISGNNIQVAMSETPSFGTVNINDANTGTITGASNVTLDNLDEDGTVGRVATEAQLAAVRNEVAGTKDIDNKLRGFKRGADAGTASAMAMAGIPQVINPGENAIGASISAYKQQTAVAVGYTRASKNGRAVLKISGSVNSNSELGFSLGFMKGWD